jgi:hypothetical protein
MKIPRLILRRRRYILLNGEIRQKRADFRRTYLFGMSNIVKENILFNPINVSFSVSIL